MATLIAAVVTIAGLLAAAPAHASTADEYTGTHFGAGNMPAGCEHESIANYANNACYHMRTGMNGLDSPQVDVLLMVPVSPTAERDVRIMREAVQMWEGGIHSLSPQMGLPWLGKGMQFHITVDEVDAVNGHGGEFTTYPIVDPEIVVIASNPVGGAGIGIDPVATAAPLVGTVRPGLAKTETPCTGVKNPFDFERVEQAARLRPSPRRPLRHVRGGLQGSRRQHLLRADAGDRSRPRGRGPVLAVRSRGA